MITIQPLSSEYIKHANRLANAVFNTRIVPPSHALEASIDPEKRQHFKQELFNEYTIRLLELRYWIAIDAISEEVTGVIGLYTTEDDHEEAAWISWFCVGETHRGKGVGTQLLEFVLTTARQEGKTYVRLFTSTDPQEAAAQQLYTTLGFRIMEERGRKKRGDYEIFYRELRLT